VTANRSAQTYIGKDNTFSATREYQFADALIKAVEAGDEEGYTAAVVEFDRITKLDNWKTAILLKIKKSIGDVGLL
jgi:alpha-soluble NSF attachment protein